MSSVDKATYLRNGGVALAAALLWFRNVPGQDSKRDAFRHAYFNALNVASFGLTKATEMGDAHEDWAGNENTFPKSMDIHNNSIGRAAYGTYVSNGYIPILPLVILRLLKDGSLKYIKNGVLVFTNQ